MRSHVMVGVALLGLLAASTATAGSAPPPHTQMIFFDWGKLALSHDDSQALDAEVAAFLSKPGGRVRVEGFSDRSGSARANLASSQARAAAVRDYLVGRGVPAAAISVAAFGEARLIIPTADGVREPQNRRVEIHFDEPALAR